MPDPHDRGPARRGRRDPELALQLAEDTELIRDPDEPDLNPQYLFDGDVVTAKVTREVDVEETGRFSSFFSYGVTTRIQDGEDEPEAFNRVATVVLERTNDLIQSAREAAAAEAEERASRPIRPRQN